MSLSAAILPLGGLYRCIASNERLLPEKIDSIHPAIITGPNQRRKWAGGIPHGSLPVPNISDYWN